MLNNLPPQLEWMRRQPQARGHKARYREEAFYDLESKAKQRIEERQMRLKSKNGTLVLRYSSVEYVSEAFDKKVILKDFYYSASVSRRWASWATTARASHLHQDACSVK